MFATFTHLIGPRKGECERFDADRILIGRAPDNQLRFVDTERRVSSHHAEVRRTGDRFILRDLGSTNGTMVNGRRVVATELKADDLLEFGAGGPLVRFRVEEERESQQAVSHPDSLGRSTVELIVDRAVRGRSNNIGIVAALVVAMMIGAAGGIAVSARLDRFDGGRPRIVEIAERSSPAVVFIRVEFDLVDGGGNVLASEARSGSGFVVSTSGLIVTNRHLVRDWEYKPQPTGVAGRVSNIEVFFPGRSRSEGVKAQLFRLSSSKESDVAVLRIEPAVELRTVHGIEGEPKATQQGEEVLVIGYPLGMDLLRLSKEDRITPTLSTGLVSRVSQDVIQLNLRAYRGNSGGPLLNRRGEVVGILTANVADAPDIALCTPISAAYDLIREELRKAY